MSEKKRLKYIDVVKGFSILLVVLGHILILYNPTSCFVIWIYSFHVPIFFILVGWLSYQKEYNNQQLKKLLKKEAKSLLYPYFTFSFIFIILDILECLILKYPSKLILKDLILTISLYGIKTLWFLTSLFIAKSIYLFQQCKFGRNGIYISNIIFIVIIYFLSQYLINVIQDRDGIYVYIRKIIQLIGRPLIALMYIYIGAFIHKKIKKEQNSCVLIIVLLFCNIVLGQLNGKVDLYTLKINNIFLYYLSATLGSISIILFFKKIINIKILEFFGRNSLIVMATHQKFPFITILKKIFEKINLYSDLTIIFTFLILIIIEALLIQIINKYAKFLIDFKYKSERSLETK